MFPADITKLQERGRENTIWERQEYSPEGWVSREGWVSKRKASSSERMGEAKQPESWVLPLLPLWTEILALGGAGFPWRGGMGAVWSLHNPAFQKDFRKWLLGLGISVPAEGSTTESNGSPTKQRRVLNQYSCPCLGSCVLCGMERTGLPMSWGAEGWVDPTREVKVDIQRSLPDQRESKRRAQEGRELTDHWPTKAARGPRLANLYTTH